MLATIVAAALVAFALASYRVVTSDLDVLLKMVPDDAFYYLQIARNLAASGRSTFDGVAPTNGYHPLWMAILTVVAAVVDDKTTLLRCAVALSLTLHATVACLVALAIRRLVDDAWGALAAVCWLVNPLAFAIAITATEAEVYAVMAVAVLLAHLALATRLDRRELPPLSQFLRYGGSLGLLCLARTEGGIIAVVAVVWLAAVVFSKTGGFSTGMYRVVACGAALVLTIAPWWLFSLSQVGTIVQDSGAMKMLWATDVFPTAISRVQNVADTFWFFGRRTLALMTVWNYSVATFLVAAATLAIAPMMVMIRLGRSIQGHAVRAIGVVMVALTVVYGLAFVERQIWWLTLPCLSTVMLMVIAFPTWLRSQARGHALEAAARVGVALLVLALFVRWHLKGHTPYPWQPDVRRSQLAIETVVPATGRIGCFNAGIPAFFGSGRVVGLDGLVNHDARLAWRNRRLDEFIARAGISYIADEERIITKAQRFASTPLMLSELSSYPLRGWPTGRRVLWQVGSGQRRSGPTSVGPESNGRDLNRANGEGRSPLSATPSTPSPTATRIADTPAARRSSHPAAP